MPGIDDWQLTPQSSHVAALTWEESGTIPLRVEALDRHGHMMVPAFGDLYVAFKSGAVYRYEGVSQNDYALICAAKSVGGALHRLGISDGRRRSLIGRFDPEQEDHPS